jgi:hypothetical protein
MADKRAVDGHGAVEYARRATAEAATRIRRMADLDAALELADILRDHVGEPATNVRFILVVDEYVRVGYNYTRLGESLGLSRQRAAKLVEQARKRGIVPPPKK